MCLRVYTHYTTCGCQLFKTIRRCEHGPISLSCGHHNRTGIVREKNRVCRFHEYIAKQRQGLEAPSTARRPTPSVSFAPSSAPPAPIYARKNPLKRGVMLRGDTESDAYAGAKRPRILVREGNSRLGRQQQQQQQPRQKQQRSRQKKKQLSSQNKKERTRVVRDEYDTSDEVLDPSPEEEYLTTSGSSDETEESACDAADNVMTYDGAGDDSSEEGRGAAVAAARW